MLVEGVVYFESTGGQLHAVDSSTGQQLWNGNEHVSKGVAIDRGIVYYSYATAHNRLSARDALTGETLWESEIGYLSTDPIATQGVIYVGATPTGEHDRIALHAVDAATGEGIWKHETGFIAGSPVVADGVVYFTTYDHSLGTGNWEVRSDLHAVDAATGDLLWRHRTGNADPWIAVANNTVYLTVFINYNNERLELELHAVNASTGELRWSYSGGSWLLSLPVVVDGVAYFLDRDHRDEALFALDASNGKLRWRQTVVDADLGFATRPTVTDGVVYVGSTDGRVSAWAASNGNPLWKYDTGGIGISSAVVVDGKIYFGSGKYRRSLFALDAASGELLWHHTPERELEGSPFLSACPAGGPVGHCGGMEIPTPFVEDGVVIYFFNGSYNSHLYALDTSTLP